MQLQAIATLTRCLDTLERCEDLKGWQLNVRTGGLFAENLWLTRLCSLQACRGC